MASDNSSARHQRGPSQADSLKAQPQDRALHADHPRGGSTGGMSDHRLFRPSLIGIQLWRRGLRGRRIRCWHPQRAGSGSMEHAGVLRSKQRTLPGSAMAEGIAGWHRDIVVRRICRHDEPLHRRPEAHRGAWQGCSRGCGQAYGSNRSHTEGCKAEVTSDKHKRQQSQRFVYGIPYQFVGFAVFICLYTNRTLASSIY